MSDPSGRSALAEAVYQARLAKGWSKEQAARVAGVSSITWKRVEDDLPVQEHKLRAVSEALGWEPRRAFALKAVVAEEADDAPVRAITDDMLMAELQELSRQVQEMQTRLDEMNKVRPRGPSAR